MTHARLHQSHRVPQQCCWVSGDPGLEQQNEYLIAMSEWWNLLPQAPSFQQAGGGGRVEKNGRLKQTGCKMSVWIGCRPLMLMHEKVKHGGRGGQSRKMGCQGRRWLEKELIRLFGVNLCACINIQQPGVMPLCRGRKLWLHESLFQIAEILIKKIFSAPGGVWLRGNSHTTTWYNFQQCCCSRFVAHMQSQSHMRSAGVLLDRSIPLWLLWTIWSYRAKCWHIIVVNLKGGGGGIPGIPLERRGQGGGVLHRRRIA